MKRIKRLPSWLLLALSILGLGGIGAAIGQQLGRDVPAAVALERPAFVDDDITTNAVGEKIQDEAGIAAYYKAPNSLNLEMIRPLFNSIELESADYILGSISVPSYSEHFDAHVYVRRDGWIMAYYLASAPSSKAIDTTAENLDNSKLKTIMNNVAVTGGAPFGAVTYYNFNYPNATHMLLVGEDGDVFRITIPSSYSYYEISWAGQGCCLDIDGKSPSYTEGEYYGSLPITAFLPDVVHVFNPYPSYYAALVIVYRQP
jgi:hypothetical protein